MIGPAAKVVVSLFIIAIIAYQWAWDLPEDSVLRRGLGSVRARLWRIGFGHSWKLFAPRPPEGVGELYVEIDGRDGRRYVLSLPLDDYGPRWGQPSRRMIKARTALTDDVNPGFRRSLSRWLVDEYLPEGPAGGRDWTGAARVRGVMVRRPAAPLHDPEARPPPFERELFDIVFPAP